MLSAVPRDLLTQLKQQRGKQEDVEIDNARLERISLLFERLVEQASLLEACPSMSRTRRWYFLKCANTRKSLEDEGVGKIIIQYILQRFGNIVFPISESEKGII